MIDCYDGMAVPVVHFRSPLSLLVTRPAVQVAGTATLSAAGALMGAENVSALVVDNGTGIVSERDMTRALAAGLGGDSPVSAVATAAPLTVRADISILDAAAMMLNQEVRHLVVTLSDTTLAVVSLRAVFAVLLQAAQPETWLIDLRERIELSQSELWLG